MQCVAAAAESGEYQQLPERRRKGQSKANSWNNGAGKGANATGGCGGNGKGANSDSAAGASTSTTTGPTTAAAANKAGATAEEEDHRDPAERVKEIRAEEDRLRRARGQYPRMVATIDNELAQLSEEWGRLQPLGVNLQAAAGRTAHARAALSRAREKKVQAAKELRAHVEAFKNSEKEVDEA